MKAVQKTLSLKRLEDAHESAYLRQVVLKISGSHDCGHALSTLTLTSLLVDNMQYSLRVGVPRQVSNS